MAFLEPIGFWPNTIPSRKSPNFLCRSLIQERSPAGPLYALQLAQEKKVLNTSMDQIGASTLLMEAAATAVIDLQLHHGMWNRSQAIDYLKTLIGHSHPYPENIVDWLSSHPGSGVRSFFGFLEVWSIRQDALDILGDGFDDAAFHARLLSRGAASPRILRQNIAEWLHRPGFAD